MPGSRDVPDQRSPRDAILDVLASAKVKCPFAFEEIAESIMHALAIASADRQPDPAPTRIPVQSTKVIAESLSNWKSAPDGPSISNGA